MNRNGLTVLGIALSALFWTFSAWGYEVVEVKDGGTVAGRIHYQGEAPAQKELHITKNENVCGVKPLFSQEFVVSKKGTLKNVVVSLVGIEKGKAFKKKSPRLIQRQCMFVPHVSLIPVGKQFRLVNEDKLLHNLRTLSKKNAALNIAHPKFKKTLRIKKKFKKPEVMRIKCDIHNWMAGWLFAIGHPYYAVSRKSGKFTLKNVPPGTYKLQAWHGVLGTQVQTVTVPAGGEVKADFTFKK